MNNVLQLITRLKSEYGCRLTQEQILNYLNSLEKRLCVEILKDTEFMLCTLNGEKEIPIDFHAMDIISVYLNGNKLTKTTATKKGYRTSENTFYIDVEQAKGELKIEHFCFPEQYSNENAADKKLILSDGHEDVYIYHILSREALLENDISRLNNYSLLYTQALNTLKQEVENKNESSADSENAMNADKENTDTSVDSGSGSKAIRFSKIW